MVSHTQSGEVDFRGVAGELDLHEVGDVVYWHLRDMIVRGLRPGTPLPLAQIAEQLSVSTMPVRAALLRLESDGLVKRPPRRGAVVAPMTMEDLEEIQAVRFGIEGFAARLGAQRLDRAHLEEMRSLVQKLRDVTVVADPRLKTEEYLQNERLIRGICYAASMRQRLLELVTSYQAIAERYVRLALVSDDSGLAADVDLQERFVDACEAQDLDGVEVAVRATLQWTIDFCKPLLPVHEAKA